MLDLTQATESFALDAEAMVAKEVLPEVMKAVCCMYDDDFRNMREKNELLGGKNLFESVYLLLCVLFYNVLFNAVDVDELCVFSEKILKSGGHGLIVCSAVQSAFRRRRFWTLTEVVG